MTEPTAADEAVKLIAEGFAVTPVATGKKKPVMADWTKKPITDPAMARTFLGNPGTRNYGVLMPLDAKQIVVVLDVDDGDGATEPWRDRMRSLIARNGALPPTRVHGTPSGGRHLFFLWPRATPPKGDTFLGFTLRVLNGRHQVLGPGSEVNGKPYTVISEVANLPTLPETWIEAFNEAKLKPRTPTIREIVEPQGPMTLVPVAQVAKTPLIVVTDEPEGYSLPDRVEAGGRYAAIRDYVASKWNAGLDDDALWDGVVMDLVPRFADPLSQDELTARFERTLTGIEARLGERAVDKATHEDPTPVEVTPTPPKSDLFTRIDDYNAALPDKIDWLVEPYAYLGGVSLISGPPKAGKSSFAANLQACRETGEKFLGAFDVEKGPTLLLTEEGGFAVRYKTEGLKALWVMDRQTAIERKLDLEGWLNAVASWAVDHPRALIFIDTLAVWGMLKDENDASEMTRVISAIKQLAQLRQSPSAVVLIHHTRKGGGDYGEAIRGSGAILGTVETSIEFKRPDDAGRESDDRIVDLTGRLIMPMRHRVAFDRPSKVYTLVDEQERALAQIEEDLTGLPVWSGSVDDKGMKPSEIAIIWGITKRGAQDRLNRLEDKGRVHVEPGPGRSRVYWGKPPAFDPKIRVSSHPVRDDG